MVTVITAYLSYVIKAVAAERVAECGGLLPKNSVFPIYSKLHRTLSSGSKKWPMSAKIGRFLLRLRDTVLDCVLHRVTSVPALRDTPCDKTNHRYFEFN